MTAYLRTPIISSSPNSRRKTSTDLALAPGSPEQSVQMVEFNIGDSFCCPQRPPNTSSAFAARFTPTPMCTSLALQQTILSRTCPAGGMGRCFGKRLLRLFSRIFGQGKRSHRQVSNMLVLQWRGAMTIFSSSKVEMRDLESNLATGCLSPIFVTHAQTKTAGFCSGFVMACKQQLGSLLLFSTDLHRD